mgnify:CR=1 FL=1
MKEQRGQGLKRSIVMLTAVATMVTSVPAGAFAEESMPDNASVAETMSAGASEEELLEQEAADQGAYAATDGEWSNDEMLAAYLDRQVVQAQAESGLTAARDAVEADDAAVRRGTLLTGNELYAYNYLADKIRQIAAGQITSAEFEIPFSALNNGKMTFTREELDVSSITSGTQITKEASDAISEIYGVNMDGVINALLADYPYDMYWYDKTTTGGYGIETLISSHSCSAESITLDGSSKQTIQLHVAAEYSADGTTGGITTGSDTIQAVNNTVPNAQAVVTAAAAAGCDTDYKKVKYYADWIVDVEDEEKDDKDKTDDPAADDRKDDPNADGEDDPKAGDKDDPEDDAVCVIDDDLPASLSIGSKSVKITLDQTACVYTGEEIRPECVLTYDVSGQPRKLREDTDYAVTYAKNVKAGKATATFTGKGRLKGTVKKTFTIQKAKITDLILDEESGTYEYAKGGVKPAVTVRSGDVTLTMGTDYTVKYAKNTRTGSQATVTVTGKGNYSDKKTETFTIIPADADNVIATATDITYTGKKAGHTTKVVLKDAVTGKKLVAGTDYEKTIVFRHGDTVLTSADKVLLPTLTELEAEITLKGNYNGTVKATYRVVQASMAKATVKAGAIFRDEVPEDGSFDYLYDRLVVTAGGVIVPRYAESLTNDPGEELKANYEILQYAYDAAKGKITFVLHGLNNYGGTKSVSITAAKPGANHVVIFDPNGATSGKMSDKKMQLGKSYVLPRCGFRKNGFEFAGWSTTPAGEPGYQDGAAYPASGAITPEQLGKVTTLYATWKEVVYTVRYVSNGQEIGTAGYVYAQLRTGQLTLPTPESTDAFNFIGWFTDPKFSAESAVTAESLTDSLIKDSDREIIVYARWKLIPAETMTRKVQKPEGDYIDVTNYAAKYNTNDDAGKALRYQISERSSWDIETMSDAVPNDAGDDYKALRAAFIVAGKLYRDSGSKERVTVYVPAGVYDMEITNQRVWGLQLEEGVELVMDNDAVFKYTVADDYKEGYFYLLSVADMHDGQIANVSIRGGQISGPRYTYSGKISENAHGLTILGATDVTISDMRIYDNHGDGVYIGTKKEDPYYYGCKEVRISYCDVFDNRRNNVSIVDVKGLTIDHCNITNARGAQPECGIIIEPNFEKDRTRADAMCGNVTISDCYVAAWDMDVHTYDGGYATCMCLYTNYNPNDSGYCVVDGLTVTGCTFDGYVGIYSGKNVTIKKADNTFNGDMHGVS